LPAASPCAGAEAGRSRATQLVDAVGAVIALKLHPQAVPEAPAQPNDAGATDVALEIEVGRAEAGAQEGIEVGAEVLDRFAALQVKAAQHVHIGADNRVSQRPLVLRPGRNR